jgi:hypothetical protein
MEAHSRITLVISLSLHVGAGGAKRRCEMNEPHYTDSHLTPRGSSVDIVERCAAFIRQCGDFEGLLDYAENEKTPGKHQRFTARSHERSMAHNCH